MQETLLRVLVVAVGLLTYQKDDPGLENWDAVAPTGPQSREQGLLGVEDGDWQEVEAAQEEERAGEPDNTSRGAQEQDLATHRGTLEVTDPEVTVKGDVSAAVLKGEPEESVPAAGEQEITRLWSVRSPRERQVCQSENSEEKETLAQSSANTKRKERKDSEREGEFLRHVGNLLSVLSVLCFFWKCLRGASGKSFQSPEALPVICSAAAVSLPDSSALMRFYADCVRASPETGYGKEEFLEGFADDLLAAMRSVLSDRDAGMKLQGFQLLNGRDILVPLTPPESFSFQHRLSHGTGGSVPLPDTHLWGQIQLVEGAAVPAGCPCQAPGADEDVVCLLHSDTERVEPKASRDVLGLLCARDSPLLSKSRVSRWFRGTLTRAWAQISHKYEFELSTRRVDALGALTIRFRSGKKISFTVNPAVHFSGEAHFSVAPWSLSELDTHWALSLTAYEGRLMEELSGQLPENSCHTPVLEIALFLHRRHAGWLGGTALKDLHFRAALVHLLLQKREPAEWGPGAAAGRLRDLLTLVESSLRRKRLHHVLVGNSAAPFVELPAEIAAAGPLNLLRPLAEHRCMHESTVMAFQEMMRNAHMLVQDYVARFAGDCDGLSLSKEEQ